MSATLSMLLIIAALVTVVWILHQIRKFKVKMEDAIFWVFFAATLLILALFPGVSAWLSRKMGFISPANLVFVAVIFLLTEKIFTLSIIVSQLEEKVSILSAEIALRSQAASKEIRQEGIRQDETEEKKRQEAAQDTELRG